MSKTIKPITDDGHPEKAGMRVEARIFLVVAAFVLLMTVVYGIFAHEDAGTTMLLLSAALGATIGGYLVVQSRRGIEPASPDAPSAAAVHYLPHASVWPFAIGMGAVLLGNGIALGLWAVVPGLVLLGFGVWGFARQSRRRD